MENEVIIHTDGGSRGNPGPAASAFVVEVGGDVIYSAAKYLGTATNNFAEYQGVILALNWLSNNSDYDNKNILFVLDSELVVRQLNGIYKVRDENIKKLYAEVGNLISQLSHKLSFKSVPRSENKIADSLVNKCLDANL